MPVAATDERDSEPIALRGDPVAPTEAEIDSFMRLLASIAEDMENAVCSERTRLENESHSIPA